MTNNTKNATARSVLIRIPAIEPINEPAAALSAFLSLPFIRNSAIRIPKKRPMNPPNGGKSIKPIIKPKNPNSIPFFEDPPYFAPMMPAK